MALGILDRLESWQFHHGLDMLLHAYRTSNSQPKRDRERVGREWKSLLASIENEDVASDAEGNRNRLIDLDATSKVAMKLIREAFVISLFHFWEREAQALVGAKGYKHERVMSALVNRGLSPECETLHTLQLVANVAKHSAGSSATKLYEKRPDLFIDAVAAGPLQISYKDDEVAPAFVPGYESLVVSAGLLDTFFEAVRRSGPLRLGIPI